MNPPPPGLLGLPKCHPQPLNDWFKVAGGQFVEIARRSSRSFASTPFHQEAAHLPYYGQGRPHAMVSRRSRHRSKSDHHCQSWRMIWAGRPLNVTSISSGGVMMPAAIQSGTHTRTVLGFLRRERTGTVWNPRTCVQSADISDRNRICAKNCELQPVEVHPFFSQSD